MGLFSKLLNQSTITKKYSPKASLYKMDTLEDIEAIPVPTEKFKHDCDFTESIEYVLQRKATQFKKDGQMDLAIACLRKANMIMPYSPTLYSKKDYERLEEYIKLSKDFKLATIEAINSKSLYEKQESLFHKEKVKQISVTGLIEVTRNPHVCSECAKYHGRIYSKDKKHGFPDADIFINYYISKSCNCILTFYPFWYKTSTPTICSEKNLIKYSNRPFVDDRNYEEIAFYNRRIEREKTEAKDRSDYAWLCEYIPNIAPKSFSGYRNMKNKNSANYQKIVSAAKEHGYVI